MGSGEQDGSTGFQPVIAELFRRSMIPAEINELPAFRVSYRRMGQAHAGGRTHAPKGVCCNGPYAGCCGEFGIEISLVKLSAA
jgi:hypothetical protein